MQALAPCFQYHMCCFRGLRSLWNCFRGAFVADCAKHTLQNVCFLRAFAAGPSFGTFTINCPSFRALRVGFRAGLERTLPFYYGLGRSGESSPHWPRQWPRSASFFGARLGPSQANPNEYTEHHLCTDPVSHPMNHQGGSVCSGSGQENPFKTLATQKVMHQNPLKEHQGVLLYVRQLPPPPNPLSPTHPPGPSVAAPAACPTTGCTASDILPVVPLTAGKKFKKSMQHQKEKQEGLPCKL